MPILERTAYKILPFMPILCTLFLAAAGQDTPSNQPPTQPGKWITLNVTVTDQDEQAVTDLKATDFQVYEDSEAQKVIAAQLADIPACLGILLDNSGSMRHTVSAVSGALYNFVKAGNPQTLNFLVNFNDASYLDVDFTNDPEKVREGLSRADARGGTAIYDTIVASADHFTKRAGCGRRILLLLTDGEDNSSRETRGNAIKVLRNSGVTLYAVALPYDKSSGRASRYIYKKLEDLALPTGGTVSFIENLNDTNKVLRKIADQIRNQYMITYIQSDTNGNRKRKSLVKVSTGARNDLAVHTTGNPVVEQVAGSK